MLTGKKAMKKLLLLVAMAGFVLAGYPQIPDIYFSVQASALSKTVAVYATRPVSETIHWELLYPASGDTTGRCNLTLEAGDSYGWTKVEDLQSDSASFHVMTLGDTPHPAAAFPVKTSQAIYHTPF